MKGQAIAIKHLKQGSAGFDDNYLYLSLQQAYTTFEELKSNATAFRKSNHNEHYRIALDAIRTIGLYDTHDLVWLAYTVQDKLLKHQLFIADASLRSTFCKELLKNTKLIATRSYKDRLAGLGLNLVYLMMAVFVGAGLIYATTQDTTSRHHLVTAIVQLLGDKVVLAVVLLPVGYFLFRIVSTMIFPPQAFIFEKPNIHIR